MKTFLFIASFLLIISCKKEISTKHESPTELEQKQVNKAVVSSAGMDENNNNHSIEEQVVDKVGTTKESNLDISVSEKKDPPAIKKEAVAEKNEEATTKNIETVTKEVVAQGAPEVKQEPVIAKANHEDWNTLSKKYVSSNGKVNYKGFKNELAAIESYLLHLQNTPPAKGWSKNEKLAYWFNLYNASTVHLVASNYPVKSIKDINGGKPWDKKFIKSGTNLYSLNDIENTIVRPNYNEPRLHVAFNCAAVSCPNLLNGAFIPAKLNSQLSTLSKKWLNDTSKNKITADNIEISQIFNWYKADFKEGVVPFVNKYQTITVSPTTAVTYMEYNWSLNE